MLKIQNCTIQAHTFQPSKTRSSYPQRTAEMYSFSNFYKPCGFLFLTFNSYVMKPHEAQMFQSRGQLLLVNLLRHRCRGAEVIYFVFTSEMENRTLSQMCGRVYLPIFPSGVRLLILMYIACFMYHSLAIFCPSLLKKSCRCHVEEDLNAGPPDS